MGDYDLIVVGAGPGGSTAAMTAAKAGMKTLLLERSRYPGEKNASGCALSSKAWRDFSCLDDMELPSMRMGRYCIAHFLSPPPQMEERFSFGSGTSQRISYPEGRDFFTVSVLRRELDQFLADKAVEAGAELELTSLVTGLVRQAGEIKGVRLEGGEEFRAPVVIGADGVLSTTARLAGLRDKWRPDQVVSACVVDYSAPRERLDAVIHEASFQAYFSPGIGGNFLIALAEGLHLGGPGVTNSLVSRVIRRRKKPARELLDTLLAPPTRRLLEACDAAPREWQVHLLPWMDTMPTDIFAGGLILVGDAAGLPEPLYAEGVWQAMYSGRLASQVALEAVEEGDTSASSLQRYLHRLKESPVGQEFIAGRELRRLFEMAGDPKLFGDLTEMIVDLMVNMFMTAQEPKAETIARAFPIVAKNLPVLLRMAGIYMPAMLKIWREKLRRQVASIKGLESASGEIKGGEAGP